MAIATTPLFKKISGSAGPVDFRTRRNGKIEIGKKRIPSNPQSTEQQNTRNAYGRLHELWQNAAWIDITQYENIAADYDISAWNAFLKRHMPIMRLNPVAYWPFVEGSGATAHDFSVNNIHGVIDGPSWETRGKYAIPFLFFDGINDFIHCGEGGDKLDIGVGSWFSTITPTSFTDHQYHTIIAKRHLSAWYLGLDLNTGIILLWVAGNPHFSLTAVDLNRESKFGATWDGSLIKFYINGQHLIGEDVVELGPPSTNDKVITIGGDEAIAPGQFEFTGNNNEIILFDYPLSNNAIEHLNHTAI